jgi:hypothetical protein
MDTIIALGLLIAFSGLLFFALKNSSVGVAGLEIRRDNNWLGYWTGVLLIALALGASIFLIIDAFG